MFAHERGTPAREHRLERHVLRCRAICNTIRQSKPDSGLVFFLLKFLIFSKVFPPRLRAGCHDSGGRAGFTEENRGALHVRAYISF